MTARGRYLGEFEQLILITLLRLKDRAYGVAIRREIEERTGRFATIGSVYATLERLERKGFVKTRITPSEPRPGGRWKKHFSITGEGSQALRTSREMISRMLEGLDLEEDLS